LHQLGERPVAHFVASLADDVGLTSDDLLRRLRRWQVLDPAVIRSIAGDRFPATKLHQVPPRDPS
jgi:hypothetical protein